MIQRKQSLFLLLISIIAMVLLLVDPTFYIENGKVALENSTEAVEIQVRFQTTQLSEDTEARNLGMSGLLIAIAGLSFIAIFLYKNRRTQNFMVMLNYLLILVLFSNMFWYSMGMNYTEMDTVRAFQAAVASPLSLLILNFLAQRGIRQDEKLVKSLDRLR